MKNFYEVLFAANESPNVEVSSRYFNTIRAARSWRKWLAAKAYVQSVRIMQGGAVGMEVK